MQTANTTLSLSIMSGKGGVGKTNLALNLGYALFGAGKKVMLMDCDIGLANLDVLLGLSPEKNLQDLLLPGVSVRDVVVSIEQGGFDFLPATSGVPELVEMDEDIQVMLMEKLKELASEYDFLALDLGAGISKTVLAFAAITHLQVMVITPEPTSLTDGYAMMKVLHSRYGVSDFHVVVNQMSSPQEGQQTFDRLRAASKKFLGIDVTYLGGVHQDPAVIEAVRRQRPLLKMAPASQATKDILALAKAVYRWRQERLGLLASGALKDFPSQDGEIGA